MKSPPLSNHSVRLTIILLQGLILLIGFTLQSNAESFEGEAELLKKLTPQERLTYYGVQYQMNKYQKRQFLSLSTVEERGAWIDRFWIDLDPTPTTEINERRIEHERRVRLSLKLFRKDKAPGWDRRGEILIRFGLPASRLRTWGNIGFYRTTPPGEIWYYESLDMLIKFQDYNLKGEYIFAIEPYGRSSRQELDSQKELIELFDNEVIQNIYPTQLMDLDEIKAIAEFNPDEIDYTADKDIRIEEPKNLIDIIEQEKIEKAANNFYKYMEEKPTIYSFELVRNLLSLYFDITAFHGGSGKIRTEVNFEVPSREVNFIQREGILEAEVELRVVVRDITLKHVTSARDVIKANQPGGAIFSGPSHLPGQVILTLEPGYYRLGLEAIDINSGRRGVYKTNLELAPLDESLSISDIQFASTIKETEENLKFVKGNLQVVPHPLHAYRIPYPLRFYFEIYELDTDSEGLAFYSVEYKIVPLQKRRKGPILEEIPPAISSSFKTTGYGSKQVERLEIATENLWKGSFELTITVTDRRALTTAEKSTRFSLLD